MDALHYFFFFIFFFFWVVVKLKMDLTVLLYQRNFILEKPVWQDQPQESFWSNITKFGVYLCYRHCFKLFKKLRKKSEFQQQCCRNSTKVWEKKKKSGRDKILNFGNLPATQICWLKINRGNAITENGRKKKIMVTEIWGGIKKKKCYVHNIFTRFLQQIMISFY